VTCCDECNREHWVVLVTKCRGLMVGGGVSFYPLGGIAGKNCPGGYKGRFFEWAVGPVTGFRGANVSGGGFGLMFGAGITWCDYTIKSDLDVGECMTL